MVLLSNEMKKKNDWKAKSSELQELIKRKKKEKTELKQNQHENDFKKFLCKFSLTEF